MFEINTTTNSIFNKDFETLNELDQEEWLSCLLLDKHLLSILVEVLSKKTFNRQELIRFKRTFDKTLNRLADKKIEKYIDLFQDGESEEYLKSNFVKYWSNKINNEIALRLL